MSLIHTHICYRARKQDISGSSWHLGSAPYGGIMTHMAKHTHTLLCERPRRCHCGDIDENLVRQRNTVAFHFCLFCRGCLMNLKCGKRQSTGGGKKGPDMRTDVWMSSDDTNQN